jgi:transcriptional regulator GlxA family with amidase domain
LRTSLLFLLLNSTFIISCSSSEKEAHELEEGGDTSLNLVEGNYNVAFLIMDGVYNTELTAPYDIFHHTIFRDSIKAMNVFTVANTLDPITSFEGIKLLPDFNYLSDDVPTIDILVVPSAEHHLDSDLEDGKMLDFVRSTSEKAEFVMSHCDGAFVLAQSGILDGYESTTFPGDVEAYEERFPHLTVHDSDSLLFVHDGKFITSAGGAKSFEASLYLCQLLYGKKVADEIAEGMVINWDLGEVPHLKVD